jgi:hypothetical protein
MEVALAILALLVKIVQGKNARKIVKAKNALVAHMAHVTMEDVRYHPIVHDKQKKIL